MADKNAIEEDESCLRILIATDNHIGYMEKDVIRGNDSVNSFEEVLQIAKKNDVDFVLLGGDLFHENKPSRNMLHHTIALLRKYCMGDKPVSFELLSDQAVNFGHTQFPIVNYEDQNLNIGMPVFSIHGNHDDPTGSGNLCSLDIISAAGLVNYFGKTTSLDKIEISPLLIQKGTTKLALYGLGAQRDERLHRMFVHKDITMLRPRENKEDWFNVFVIHQNHSKHGPTNYIPEQFLDDFLDLVFWGHEHECKIEPAWNSVQNFYVTQPGSSVATSLSEGETRQKHVGILTIKNKEFKIKKIELKTVRPFYMEDVVLADTSLNPDDPDVAKKVLAYCTEKVQALLDKAEIESTERQPNLPLIRLRIDYSGGFDMFNIHRFGQKFVDKIANPKDIILFQKKKAQNADAKAQKQEPGVMLDMSAESLDTARVEDMVREYFSKADKSRQLNLLSERGMGEAVKEFVDKEEKEAIKELVNHQLSKTQEYLQQRNAQEDVIDMEVIRYKEERQQRSHEEEEQEVKQLLEKVKSNRSSADAFGDISDDDTVAEDGVPPPTTTRGRGRGRGRAASGRGSRGGRGGRGKAAVTEPPASNRSITDAFSSQRSSSRAVKNKKFIDSDSDDAVILDDSDDNNNEDTFSRGNTKKANGAGKGTSVSRASQQKATPKGKRGVAFSDSDDEFNIPMRKKKR